GSAKAHRRVLTAVLACCVKGRVTQMNTTAGVVFAVPGGNGACEQPRPCLAFQNQPYIVGVAICPQRDITRSVARLFVRERASQVPVRGYLFLSAQLIGLTIRSETGCISGAAAVCVAAEHAGPGAISFTHRGGRPFELGATHHPRHEATDGRRCCGDWSMPSVVRDGVQRTPVFVYRVHLCELIKQHTSYICLSTSGRGQAIPRLLQVMGQIALIAAEPARLRNEICLRADCDAAGRVALNTIAIQK